MKRVTIEVVLLVEDFYEFTILDRAREVLTDLTVYPENSTLEKFEVEVVTTQP